MSGNYWSFHLEIADFTQKMKKFFTYMALLIFFLFGSGKLFGQERGSTINGIVFDVQTKQRVSRVFLFNVNNDEGGYNNLKGEFQIQATRGDTIVAAAEGYLPDTLIVSNQPTEMLYLQRASIRIKEVTVLAHKNPDDLLKENQREYSTAYSKGATGDFLTVGPGGAGLSIDALYSLISREGRNARRLQAIIQRDYEQAVIDYRFNPELVSQATGLKGDTLRDFMRQYRPSYFFVLFNDEYQLVTFIKESFEQYKRNPSARRLPPLPRL